MSRNLVALVLQYLILLYLFVMLKLTDEEMWHLFTFIQGIFIYGKVHVYAEQSYRTMLLFHFTDIISYVCMYYIQQSGFLRSILIEKIFLSIHIYK